MSEQTVSELLRRAVTDLQTNGLNRGTFFGDNWVGHNIPQTGCACTIGAMARATDELKADKAFNDSVFRQAEKLLTRHIGRDVGNWNDESTFATIIRTLTAVAEEAEGQ